MSNPAVLLIGGPDTGKSNFLFRAWMHIDSGNGLVEKNGLPSDAEYLQSGAECQLRGKFSGHTSHEVQVISNIPICLRSDSHKKALLVIPDINGEQIDRIYHARKWSYDWESLITESSAYLFFVRVNSLQTIAPLDWITCHSLCCGTPALTPMPDHQGNDSAKIVEKTVDTPTQVVLVDWLQFILQAVHDRYPHTVRPRVGIIVAAWDCVANDYQGGPSEWIQENMPLLHQFCITNQAVFEISFFGSSIFSGDPENDSEFANELGQKDPRTTGYVLHSLDNIKSDDFTIPIAWALGWQSAS
ncbi:MAG: hypothetical protein ABIK28_14650 [Planctomycetota bacterium]